MGLDADKQWQKHSLAALLASYDEPSRFPAPTSPIWKQCIGASYETASECLANHGYLRRAESPLGLLRERLGTETPTEVAYTLTDKGRKIADSFFATVEQETQATCDLVDRQLAAEDLEGALRTLHWYESRRIIEGHTVAWTPDSVSEDAKQVALIVLRSSSMLPSYVKLDSHELKALQYDAVEVLLTGKSVFGRSESLRQIYAFGNAWLVSQIVAFAWSQADTLLSSGEVVETEPTDEVSDETTIRIEVGDVRSTRTNAYKVWTLDERVMLYDLAQAGCSSEDIAERLERQVSEVQEQLFVFRIPPVIEEPPWDEVLDDDIQYDLEPDNEEYRFFKDLEQLGGDDVQFLGFYHPYLKGNNTEFDEYSRQILKLKDSYGWAIEAFYNRLDPILGHGFAIATVPSHTPNKRYSGVRMLAMRLARNNRVDATGCLIRHKEVEKLSGGGSRRIEVHLESIRVVQPDVIRGRPVLLLDDVYTTGNSLKACKKLLLEAGAAEVQCYALGKTVSPKRNC